jgi:1,4-dihydroxy-2-naphthoate octaprenyltransferase
MASAAPRANRPDGRAAASSYIRALRIPFVSSSLAPVGLGVVLAVGVAGADWRAGVLALLAGAIVQLGTNVCNSVCDFERGVDTFDMAGDARTFVDGDLTVSEGRWWYRILFGVTVLIGLGIAALTGPAILPLGIVGVFMAWAYTAGPWPYKYHALGEPLIVFLMGSLMTLGGYVATTGVWWDWGVFWAGLPCGFAVAAVLTANNLCDIEDDRNAGVTTLAGILGFFWARRLYYAEITAVYGSIVLLVAFGVLGWPVLLALLTIPFAVGRIRAVMRASGPGDVSLEPVLQQTAMVHLGIGVLLVLPELAYRLIS